MSINSSGGADWKEVPYGRVAPGKTLPTMCERQSWDMSPGIMSYAAIVASNELVNVLQDISSRVLSVRDVSKTQSKQNSTGSRQSSHIGRKYDQSKRRRLKGRVERKVYDCVRPA